MNIPNDPLLESSAESNSKSHMIVKATASAELVAAIQTIAGLRKELERVGEALKSEFEERKRAIEEDFQARHNAAWAVLTAELGLDSDANHQLDSEYFATHGLAFIRPEPIPVVDPTEMNPGELIRKLLGGEGNVAIVGGAGGS